MRIIIAPDSFKESLSAKEVCSYIERGIKRACPQAETLQIPLSDGGEGALVTLKQFIPGNFKTIETVDALQRPISSSYFLFKNTQTAWVELASASGLSQIPKNDRNPLKANTFGTGLIIKNALESGCTKIILGIGGSASNDAGTGIIAALGGQFFSKKGKQLFPCGKNLGKIHTYQESDLIQKIKNIEFIIASDVTNPLTGANGCSKIYAPQKGAKEKQTEKLEENMVQFANFLKEYTGREWASISGGGAAGGTGAGMASLLGGKIQSGFEVLTNMIDLEKKMENCDLIITGEGKYDAQSSFGKLVFKISNLAARKNIPVVVLAGKAENIDNPNITSVFSIADGPMSAKIAMKRTGELLTKSAYQVVKLFMV